MANEISVFFNHQNFTCRLKSGFDFWHVDRHEWKKQGSLTVFLKKFSFGEMGHLGPKKLCIYITLGSQEEFCTMKKANRQMKVITMVCTQKKFVQDKWAILNPKMALRKSGSALRTFLKFCRMKNWGNVIFLTFRPLFTVWLAMVKLSQPTVN